MGVPAPFLGWPSMKDLLRHRYVIIGLLAAIAGAAAAWAHFKANEFAFVAFDAVVLLFGAAIALRGATLAYRTGRADEAGEWAGRARRKHESRRPPPPPPGSRINGYNPGPRR